jgi:hypothetical protein
MIEIGFDWAERVSAAVSVSGILVGRQWKAGRSGKLVLSEPIV